MQIKPQVGGHSEKANMRAHLEPLNGKHACWNTVMFTVCGTKTTRFSWTETLCQQTFGSVNG